MKNRLNSRLQAILPSIKACFSMPALIVSAALSWSLTAYADTVTFSSAGTFTWTCPPGVTSISVAVQGGGGGGGGGGATSSGRGGGGGGGGCAYSADVTVVPGTDYTVTVGAGGSAGAATSGTGGAGGTSSFTGTGITTLTATGGAGGALGGVSNGAATAAGTATGGTVNFSGGTGGGARINTTGGGGGGGAGTTSAGGNASGTNGTTPGTGGTGSPAGGAGTGNGNTVGGGTAGNPPGGGGAGAYRGSSTQAGKAGGAGQVTLAFTAPANYKLNNTDNLNLASSWSVGVPLGNIAKWDNTVTGANATVLGGDVAFGGIQIVDPGGPVTINAGNLLTLGSAAVALGLDLSAATQDLTLNCDVATATANVWNVATGRTVTLAGSLSGSSAITKQGAGSVILSGTSTYSGATTVTAGTLTYPSGSTFSPGGTGGVSGILTVNGAGAEATIAGTYNATGNSNAYYEIRGGGLLNFTGTANLSGGAGIRVGEGSAGTMNMTGGSITAVMNSGSNLVVGRSAGANGTFNLSGGTLTITNGGGISIANTAGNTGVLTVSGTGQLTMNSTGTFAMGPGTATLNLNTGGTFTLGGSSTASGTSTINFDGGTLKAGRFSTAFLPASLTAVNVLASGAIIDTNGYDITLPGALLGSVGDGGLTKSGTGGLTLAGLNTYTGTTNVNGGTLKFSTAGASASNVVVAADAGAGVLVATADAQLVTSTNLTLNNNARLAVSYGATAPSTSVAPLAVNNLNVGTGVGLLLEGDLVSTMSVGQTFPLVTWSGSGPTDGSAFTGTILPQRIAGNFSVSANTLIFTVTANTIGAISWNTGNGTWDTAAANWLDIASGPTTYFDLYDDVLFGDAAGASGNPVVTLNTTVSPADVKMNSAGHDYTITGSGAIAGATGVTLDAANTRKLTLTTANSYVGPTAIGGGTLSLGDGGTGGSLNPASPISLGSAGATFAVNQSDTVIQGTDFSGAAIGGAGGFAHLGSGTTILNAVNTYTGPSAVANGSLEVGGAGQLGAGTYAGAINLSGGGTFNFNSTAAQTLSGVIGGAGGLTKGAASTLTLTGVNTYTGSTIISAGVLQLGDGTDGNDGTLANTSGVTANGRLTFNRFGSSSAAYAITGTGGVSKTGAGTQTLSGNNTYTGSTIVNNGTLILSGANTGSSLLQVGITTGPSTFTVATGGSFTTTGNLTLGSGVAGHTLNVQSGASLSVAAISNAWGSDYHIDGTLTASGIWTVSTNSGTRVFDGAGSISAAALTLGNANTVVNYTGSGSVNIAGNVTVASNFNAGNAAYTQTSGTLNAGGVLLGDNQTNTTGSRSFNLNGGRANLGAGGIASTGTTTATRVVNFGPATLGASADWSTSLAITLTDATTGTTVNTLDSVDNTSGRTITLSGVLGGTGALTKAGVGTLVLSGANNYGGTTTVNGGTLALGANNALPSGSALTIGAATLDAATFADSSVGAVDVTGAATINLGAGSALAFADSSAIDWTGGTLTITGIFVSGSSLRFGSTSGGLTPTQISQITITGFTGVGIDANGFITATAVGGYSVWASTNAGGQTADLDFDNDGTTNGVEYFMNAAAGFTANPQLNGSNTITWTNGGNIPASAYGTRFVVQTSGNLVNWTDVPVGQLTTNTGGPGGSLTYTLTGAAPRFVRLVVTPN